MKRYRLPALFIPTILTSFAFGQHLKLKAGYYNAALKLDASTELPIRLSVELSEKAPNMVISNAEEKITLQYRENKGDTIIAAFPDFDSELRFVVSDKKHLRGYWVNYNKGENYRIPFYADLGHGIARPTELPGVNLTGKWESYFDLASKTPEVAVGIFDQKDARITGTFLTETGDYRFMEGFVYGRNFWLSCFDGSHAFLLKGTESEGSMQGVFYSGKHYQTTFRCARNESFKLTDPDSLTYMKEEADKFSFTFPDLNGQPFSFPNAQFSGKVVIVQVMGTWCPNCMDETNFFKEMYEKYHSSGLEIISIAYEAAETFDGQVQKIRTLIDRKGLDFTFLVGGKASKGIASEQFSQLNQIMSFPTAIFVGRDGAVKRIHTGFNGPGTGDFYTEYVEKTTALLEQLLSEKP